MNIDYARYFIELSRAGSFYGAAKGLYMSQQGLNKAITALEEELGTKLVERGKRGVTLTAEGQRFLEFAEKMTADYQGFLSTLYNDQIRAEEVDPTTVHVTYYASQILASSPEHMETLRDTIYLEEPFEKIQHRALNSEGSDLCFVDLHANTAAKILSDPNLVFDASLISDIGVICRADSPLASRVSLSRREVASYPCAVNGFKEMGQIFDWLFRDSPLQDVRVRVTNPRTLLRFVLAREDGIALLDSFGFHLFQINPSIPTDDLVFVPLSTPEARCLLGFLQPKHVKPTPRVSSMIDGFASFMQSRHAEYMKRYPLTT